MDARRKELLKWFRQATKAVHVEAKTGAVLPINSWLRDPKVVGAFERAIAAADPKADYIPVEGLEKPAVAIEVDGAREQWKRTNDPRWVWRAIHDRIHRQEALPDWVLDYLDKCAVSIENMKGGDHARKLHRILKFSSTSGRKRDSAIDLRDEQFAMAFAKEILRGASPVAARGNASAKVDGRQGKDDKELRQRLKKFFELKKLPAAKEQWKLEIRLWLLCHCWLVIDQYPDLLTKEILDFQRPTRA